MAQHFIRYACYGLFYYTPECRYQNSALHVIFISHQSKFKTMPNIKTVLALAAGAAIGGAIVTLIAPQTGSQTRAMLRAMLIQRFDNLLAKAEEKLEDAYDRAVSEQYSPNDPTTERSFF